MQGDTTLNFTKENVSNSMYCLPKKVTMKLHTRELQKADSPKDSSIEERPTWLPMKQKDMELPLRYRSVALFLGKG